MFNVYHNLVSSEEIMRKATNIARENLVSLGTCIGKFTKTRRFRLHITALDFMAPYAKVLFPPVTIKGNQILHRPAALTFDNYEKHLALQTSSFFLETQSVRKVYHSQSNAPWMASLFHKRSSVNYSVQVLLSLQVQPPSS